MVCWSRGVCVAKNGEVVVPLNNVCNSFAREYREHLMIQNTLICKLVANYI